MNSYTHLLAISSGSECMSTIAKTAKQYFHSENISQAKTHADALAYLASFYALDSKLPVIIFLDTSSHYSECLDLVKTIDRKFDRALKNKVVLVNANLSINQTMRMAVSQCVNNLMTCPVFDYEVKTLLSMPQPHYAWAV